MPHRDVSQEFEQEFEPVMVARKLSPRCGTTTAQCVWGPAGAGSIKPSMRAAPPADNYPRARKVQWRDYEQRPRGMRAADQAEKAVPAAGQSGRNRQSRRVSTLRFLKYRAFPTAAIYRLRITPA